MILVKVQKFLNNGIRLNFTADNVLLQDCHDIQSVTRAKDAKRCLVLSELHFSEQMNFCIFNILNGIFIFENPQLIFHLHGHRARIRALGVLAGEFGHGYFTSIRTELPVLFEGANHMKTFAVTSFNNISDFVPSCPSDTERT